MLLALAAIRSFDVPLHQRKKTPYSDLGSEMQQRFPPSTASPLGGYATPYTTALAQRWDESLDHTVYLQQ